MPIQIYNSLTRQKEEIIPKDGKTIKMYACGVTVYDKCHIGHARSLYIFDVIRRYLRQYSGYDVRFVRNITDVDDKIINKAHELKKSFEEVVDQNIAAYDRDLQNLAVAKADVEPRATQYIDKIIIFIEELIRKDFAYEVNGNVYFKVRAFEGYGKLSGQSVEQMLEASRIEQDLEKKDALDFALWKRAKPNEKFWPSPWGDGRPGWHIECSCMSMNELKEQTIDIHAGGRDLIFPHHENEIAQSEALTGQPFARYWIHHGLLTIKGQKMAKSLGNFITLDEILEKHTSDILKLFFLQSHYASPVDFTWEKMNDVKKAYQRIDILRDKLELLSTDLDETDPTVEQYWKSFRVYMDDDFNTPRALSALFDMITYCNSQLDAGRSFPAAHALKILNQMTGIFGLQFLKEGLNSDVAKLLEERKEARAGKDFKRSDELRDALKTLGIIVEDSKEGQTWRRV